MSILLTRYARSAKASQIILRAANVFVSGAQGTTATTRLTLARTGYGGSVVIAVAGVPAGVTVSFSPNPVSGSASDVAMQMAISGGASLTTNAVITVTASGANVADSVALIYLSITAGAPYEFLRPMTPAGDPIHPPQATAHGPGYTWNSSTGDWDGRAVDTTEPEWAATVALTDTGDAATNMANLNAAIVAHVVTTPITQHTKITLPAGAQFAGRVQLLAGLTDCRLGIYTDSDTSLPTPSSGDGSSKSTYLNAVRAIDHATYMPELYQSTGGGGGGVIECDNGAANYTLRGLNIANRLAQLSNAALVKLYPPTFGDATDSHYPSSIHMIQCCIQSGSDDIDHGARRGILMCGKGLAFVDGECIKVGWSSQDCQAVTPGYGPGPFEIFNSELGVYGQCEAFLTGGFTLPDDNPDAVTKDFAVVQCVLRGLTDGAAKNCGELKWGINVLIANNRCEAIGGDDTHHGNLEVKLSDQDGSGTHSVCHDIILMANWIPFGKGGICVTGVQNSPTLTDTVRRVFVANNLCTPSSGETSNAEGLSMDGDQTTDIVYIYNTSRAYEKSFGSAVNILEGDGGQTNTILKYNVLIRSETPGNFGYALIGAGNYNQPMWDTVISGSLSDFSDNLVAENGSNVSRQITSGGSVAGMGLHDNAMDELWLDSASPGYQAGPDGQDLGYQKTIFDTIQSRLRPM